MDWQTKRKVMYGAIFICICGALFLYLTKNIFFPAPTCSDGKQNGYEEGVDCGGTCSLICTQSVLPLSVLWARALPTSSSTYDLVAMISNKNINNAPHALGYSFTVLDASGKTLAVLSKTTIAPVDGDFPVIIQNVSLPGVPTSVTVALTDGPHYKVVENPTSPTLTTTAIRYEAGAIPRVYATVTNTKRIAINKLPVRVVLYDAQDNAYGAGETIIPFLDKEGSYDITFTWNMPFKDDPIKIRVYPILDPFVQSQ